MVQSLQYIYSVSPIPCQSEQRAGGVVSFLRPESYLVRDRQKGYEVTGAWN